jgi:hypothetical protein
MPTSQGHIFFTLQYFATKFCSFTKLKMLFLISHPLHYFITYQCFTYSIPVFVREKSFPYKSPSLAATSNENPFLRRWNSRTHVNLFSGFVDTSEGCRVRSIRPQRTADLNCSETCEKMRWGTISRSGHMYKVSSVHPHPLPLCNLKHGFQHFAYDLRNISSEILSWSMRFFSKGFKDNRCAQVHKNSGLNFNLGLALT